MRLVELAFLLHVVILFLGGLAAWLRWLELKDFRPALLLAAGAPALILLDVFRFRRLRQLRAIAQSGSIATGRVLSNRLIRGSLMPRADRAWPRIGFPFRSSCQVEYAFEGQDGEEHRSRMLVSARDAATWPPGRAIEVFHLKDDAAVHAPSLLLRWYWKLGGSPIVDEPPPADFEESEVEIDWRE